MPGNEIGGLAPRQQEQVWLQQANQTGEIRARDNKTTGNVEIYNSTRSFFGKLFAFAKDPLGAASRQAKQGAAVNQFTSFMEARFPGHGKQLLSQVKVAVGTPLTGAQIKEAISSGQLLEAFKSSGSKFSDLAGHDQLSETGKKNVDAEIEKAITSHPDYGKSAISESTLKSIAQGAIAAELKADNLKNIADFTTTGSKFGELADTGKLTDASKAKLDSAIDTALKSHGDFGTKTLSASDLKGIAQGEVRKLVLGQAATKQGNLSSAAAFKSTGGSFATLTDHGRLTLGQKRTFNAELERLVGAQVNVQDRALTADELKGLAQQALNVAKVANVTNIKGATHHTQERGNSCVVASSLNMIRAFNGSAPTETALRAEMRTILGDPSHDFETTGIDPMNAQTLLGNYGIGTTVHDNATLDQLQSFSKDRPIMVGFPGHRVVLDSVTTGPTGARTFNVRDPGYPNVRQMTESQFSGSFNPGAIVIVPNSALT